MYFKLWVIKRKHKLILKEEKSGNENFVLYGKKIGRKEENRKIPSP